MTSPRRARPAQLPPAGAVLLALALAAAGCSGNGGGDGDGDSEGSADPETTVTAPTTPELAERTDPLPAVTPTPREIRWLGPDVDLDRPVEIVASPGADGAALDVVTAALEAAGAQV